MAFYFLSLRIYELAQYEGNSERACAICLALGAQGKPFESVHPVTSVSKALDMTCNANSSICPSLILFSSQGDESKLFLRHSGLLLFQ